MYPLRGLNATERRLYRKALRGVSDDLSRDPDVERDGEEEATDGPKDGDAPTTPGADPGANPMRLVTANVRHGMTVANTRDDIEKVSGLGSVILWQEMNERSQPILEQELPDDTWRHIPGNVHVATRISVKRSLWTVEQAASYVMHQKNPNIQHRKPVVTIALLTSKSVTGLQFLVVNSHFVPHAWCGHNRPAKQWRQDKWNLHFDKMQDLVLDARSKGISVVGGADFNRGGAGLNKFHTNQVWFRQAALDHLFGLEAAGGATFTKNSDQSVALNSDHNALVAQLTWTAGSNPLKSGYHWPGL